jgi:hypothetical protein
VSNRDGVVSYQDVSHYQPHDSLPLRHTQRISSTAQARKKRGKILRQPQKGRAVIGLVSDGL